LNIFKKLFRLPNLLLILFESSGTGGGDKGSFGVAVMVLLRFAVFAEDVFARGTSSSSSGVTILGTSWSLLVRVLRPSR